MKDYSKNSEENNSKKRIIIYIVIIILLLLLITSCTSNFWGTIGSLFKNEGNYKVDKDKNDTQEILNQELKFDTEKLEISLSDVATKLTYTMVKINPRELTCSTSDANIATCYVENGYVTINPKSVGKVTIYLKGDANGKTYKASAKVTVTEPERYISLTSKSGTINLANGNKKIISYNVVGLTGEAVVTSSDESVAIAEIQDGTIKITGLKAGTAKITVTITYNGKEYSAVYTVKVTGKSSGSTTKPSTPGKPESTNKPKPTTKPTTNPTDNPKPTVDPTESPKPTIDPTDSPKPTVDPTDDPTNNLYLSGIWIDDVDLAGFTKEKKKYVVNLPYGTDTVKFFATAEDDQNTSISYKLNGKTVTDLNQLKLQDRVNTLEVIVTSKDGKSSNTYTVVLYKPVRLIELDKTYNIKLEQLPYDIEYTVYETKYNIVDETEEKQPYTKYKLEDIQVTLIDKFGNTYDHYDLLDGVIRIKEKDATAMLQNGPFTLEMRYKNGNTAKATLNFSQKTYTLPPCYQNGIYPIEFINNVGFKTITIPNNFFTGKVIAEILKDETGNKTGIRLKESINGSVNDDVYIDITTSNTDIIDIVLEKEEITSSPAILITALQEGDAIVHVSGVAHGVSINQFDIQLKVTEKFKVIIDANGGFYSDGVTARYEDFYPSILSSSEAIHLGDAKYKAYKVENDSINKICKYYKMVSYNTAADGSGETYPLTTVLYELKGNLTLYAQYELGTPEDKPVIEKVYNLENFNLFHNEAYFKKYNKDKVIHPGAEGSYVMTFTNNTPNTMKITKMRLTEDSTVCVPEGCINMGYSVRFNPKGAENFTYYYGAANQKYKILNKDTQVNVAKEIVFGSGVTVLPGEEVEFTLLWRWVDEPRFDVDNANNQSMTKAQYDALDTLIGKEAANLNDEYSLSVSITYENEEDYCKID